MARKGRMMFKPDHVEMVPDDVPERERQTYVATRIEKLHDQGYQFIQWDAYGPEIRCYRERPRWR